MIKTLALLKRRPDLTREAFRDHYESTHAPLALPIVTGLERYVRNHIVEELAGEVDFDVLSAFWYRDADAVAATMADLAGEAGEVIRVDELRFMDKPGNTFFSVSERLLVGRAAEDGGANGASKDAKDVEGDEHVFVLVAKPASMSRYDCSAQLAEEHFPKLLGGLGGVEFALMRDAFPMDGETLRYDAALQVRAADYGGLEAWIRMIEFTGFAVTAVRTRRFETEIAPAGA